MHLFFCDRTFALALAHTPICLFVSVQGLFGPGYVELLYGVTDSIVGEAAIACSFAVNEYREWGGVEPPAWSTLLSTVAAPS
jgi:hypothetical protein